MYKRQPQNKQKLSTTDDYDQLLNNAYLTKAVLPYIDVLTDDVDYMAADRQPNFANSADTYLGAHLWDNSIETTMPNGDETFEKFYNSIFNTNAIIGNKMCIRDSFIVLITVLKTFCTIR